MKQMFQINELLGNKKVMIILDYFMQNSLSEVSQIEVINSIGLAKATAVKWFSFLVNNEFLFLRKIGVTNLYKLNNSHVIIKQLKIINTLSLLNGLDIQDSEVYLYGSCSRGDNDSNSDIDILVVGDMKNNNIFRIIEKYSEKIGKDINFVNYTHIEYSQLRKKDIAFYNRLEKDRIRLK